MKALKYLFKNSRPNLYKNSTVSLLLPLGAFADMGKFELQFFDGISAQGMQNSKPRVFPGKVSTNRSWNSKDCTHRVRVEQK